MSRLLVRNLCGWCVAMSLLGCPAPEVAPEPIKITVTTSVASLPADGVSSLMVTVSRTGTADVKLRTPLGSFKGSATPANTVVTGGSGTVELVTCNSQTTNCSGAVRISANSDDGAVGSAVVTFVQLEICTDGKDNNGDGKIDCADPTCLGLKCTLPVTAMGTGQCDAAGKCLCATGVAEICTDGLDNNCDGKIDCLDTMCEGKVCTLPSGLPAKCMGAACVCPSTVEICDNGKDDDCDGLIDCADPDCPTSMVETNCADGRDNDCDGKVDCADSDCRPVGNIPGKICDANGNTCSNLVAPDAGVAGVSSCNVCSGNGGAPQTSEVSCGDGKDNDCDGLIDCQDPSCDSIACSSTGKRCASATQTCTCPSTVEICDNGKDDDCDGLTDCADDDCRPVGGNPAQACSSTGKFCSATGTCDCSGNGGTAELTEGATPGSTTCGDGKDNDCNGQIDCADPNCRPSPPVQPTGKNCSQPAGTPPSLGKTCDVTGICICPGGQATEASCADLLDNDCDGLIDCADSNCLGLACAANGKTCSVTSSAGCTCPSGLTNESTNANCSNHLDDDCDGLVDCSDPDCAGRQCNSGNSNYVCTPGAQSVCQDATSLYSLAVTAAKPRIPADGVATTAISAVLKNGASPVVGVTVTFVVTIGPGSLVPLTATTDATGKANSVFTAGTTGAISTITASYSGASGSTTVDQPRVGQVKFISQQFSVMGVRYSSFQETNILTFQVLDIANVTYPAGLVVAFVHSPVGGSYIGSTPTCSGSPVSCTASGVTDGQGFVTVALHSGTVASVVSVRGDAAAGGGTANATASNIAIVGAKASGLHVSLDCTPKNIPAFSNNDCTNSFVNTNIVCRAAFADRFNNVLGVPTLATFSTEAGAAGPPATTAAGGIALGSVSVAGFALPVDVPPFAGEYSLSYTSSCGLKVHNPRDGLVAIIVSAIGEEGFVDGSNGCPSDGIYNGPNSPGCCATPTGCTPAACSCLGENYVDQGEPFVDSNDNGTQDNNEPYVDANSNNVRDLPNGQWDQNTVVWAETRVLYSGEARVSSSPPALSQWFTLPTPLPPGAPQPPPFSVSLAPPPVPTNLGVYFTDLNFNQLQVGTTYAVTAIPSGPTVVFTTSPAAPVDGLGMAFTQQFCNTPAGTGTCASACQNAPCYTVSQVQNYSKGNYGVVQITAAGTAGPYVVQATATNNGVTVPISINGTVTP